MTLLYSLGVLLCTIGVVLGTSEPNAHAPELVMRDSDGHVARRYWGTIAEDETAVTLVPPLRATDKDTEGGAKYICSFKVTGKGKVPFRVDHKATSDTGTLVLKKNARLDYIRRRKYKVNVVAYDCGVPRLHSKSVTAIIEVLPVNKFAPRFAKDAYTFDVEAGKVLDNIGEVHATDDDRSDDYSKICSYSVSGAGEPFTVSSKGVLASTAALDYSHKRNHIVEVVAEDCGGRRSQPVVVTINVRPPCFNTWLGIEEEVQLDAAQGRVLPFKVATLALCPAACDVTKVEAKVDLLDLDLERCAKGHVSSDDKCAGAAGAVDLLPEQDAPKSWTKSLLTKPLESDAHKSAFEFDGLSAAVTVPGAVNHSVGNSFGFTFWLRHSGEAHAQKEHVLCMSDGEKMDRHHYSIFVHKSHIVMLIRREASQESDPDVFRPAEFRFLLAEVSDGKWHHYAFAVNFPQVSLYIDGQKVRTTDTNPDIVDDWPLHNAANKVKTTHLTVGACWQGLEQEMTMHLRGQLSGVYMTRSAAGAAQLASCLNSCAEKLDINTLADLESGMTISYNTEMTDISVGGPTVSGVQRLVRELSYINADPAAQGATRKVVMTTKATCADGKSVDIAAARTSVVVPAAEDKPEEEVEEKDENEVEKKEENKALQLSVTLAASPRHVEGEADLKRGVRLFPDLTLLVEPKSSASASRLELGGGDYTLGSCTITAKPKSDKELDGLSIPEVLADTVHLKTSWDEGRKAFHVQGKARVYIYEDFLRQVRYYHSDPRDVSGLIFSLTCSATQTDGAKVASNLLKVEVSAVHETPEELGEAAPAARLDHASVNVDHLHAAAGKHAANNAGVYVVIVLCVGFLLFMVVLAVVRLRRSNLSHLRRHVSASHAAGGEMEWDDSAELTITVNPQDELENARHDLSDSESDSDAYSERDDDLASSDDDDDDDGTPRLRDNMEWDNSALGF